MFPTSNYSLALGKSQPLRTNAECPGLTALNAVLGVSCFYGTAANLVILIFTILKHRHQGLTPDRILLQILQASISWRVLSVYHFM